ncbi:Endonuclease/exonuclease/phosphatase [Pseudocohnilembus persalinus]|uniref:Endonuclease/exonuclease/phosphatase n=1 Tax=Pseudocohnilembus persalinus TaxID=266149 RepID=A0A0V0QW07_PSEPJ|nr:Endonuclease/exonuclease/phosphatase [Pseudocohnilembus persalinus]|eukprot:KRX06069.1 Endonuclease/exonuclease/phosphatase [Pseudocohnilembus persalinus]
MSYNVLADNVAYKLFYQHTAYPYLNFKKYRGPRIIDEVKQYYPSVICMQEVDHFEDFYQEKLEQLGYKTYLNKRFKLFRHGVLVGFQKNQWDLIDVENLNYNDAMDESEYKVHAAGLLVLLKSKKSQNNLCICSMHTYFMKDQTKYAQVAYTTHRIKSFLEQNFLDAENTAIVIAGDFNAYRSSDVIKYLDGEIPQYSENKLYQKYHQVYDRYPFIFQNWSIKSAYDFYPNFLQKHQTHNLPMHKAEIDYIFYSSKSLGVTKLLKPPEQEYLLEGKGSPNKYLSSDHLRIQAEFYFK